VGGPGRPPIALAPDWGGVLLDVIGGGEHVGRAHFVLVPAGDRLVEAWKYQDQQGGWSRTAITDLGAGREGIVLFSGLDNSTATDGTPDELEAQVLGWNEAEHRLTPQPRAGHVDAVVIGSFRTIAAAREARRRNHPCLAGYSVRASTDVRGSGGGGFILVRLTSLPGAAGKALAAAPKCAPGRRGSVEALR
jgi:hypothetical protein